MRIKETYIVYYPVTGETVKIYYTLNKDGDKTRYYMETKEFIKELSFDEAYELLKDY